MADLTIPAFTTAIKAVGYVFDKIILEAESPLKARWKKWRTVKRIEKLTRQARKVRMVKTLWRTDKAIDLNRFYYPATLTFRSARIEVTTLNDLAANSKHLLVVGTVGRGKSILARYLTCWELATGERIPLFVELRKAKAWPTLLDLLFEEMRTLGMEVDSDVFQLLASSGRVSLILDGFDEVDPSARHRISDEVERLARRYERLPILVTSRPGTSIVYSPLFTVMEIAPISPEELPKVVARLSDTKSYAERVIHGIEQSHRVRKLLDTPLMVSLLLARFSVDQTVPESEVGFFDDLFQIVIKRHDATKPGFERYRKCKIGPVRMQQIFEALCLMAMTRPGDYSAHHWCSLIAKAASSTGSFGLVSEDFLDDIVRITCLIQKDGNYYRFAHRSIQEYYAARFIASLPEAAAASFYDRSSKGSHYFGNVINFLRHIDNYRYSKYVAISVLERLTDPRTRAEILSGIEFAIRPGQEDQEDMVLYARKYVDDLLMRVLYPILNSMRPFVENEIEKMGSLEDRIEFNDLMNASPEAASALQRAIEDACDKARDTVSRKDSLVNLFDGLDYR